jgi:peptide chain release factor 1
MSLLPIEKLNDIEARYETLQADMANPEIISDNDRYRKTAKAVSDLEDLVKSYRTFKELQSRHDQARGMLSDSDPEMQEMARAELDEVAQPLAAAIEELRQLLVPTDPNDFKDVVLEIRAGAGGDEASLFAAEVFRMYTRYAELKGWKIEILGTSESGAGGYKDISAMISGKKVYATLKYEGGVHRVQRVPATETQGRIHTSTITVVVLPEADEVEVHIEANDLRIDTFCASGPGGQSVNTTKSAVRITHIPTGMIVSMQDEKSQIKNRDKAMRVLRSRLYEAEMEKQMAAQSADRKQMVGSGDRSEKVRTYNFPQNRVTDHRIGLTLHQLDLVMEGKIEPFVNALTAHYNAEKLQGAA